MSILNNKFYIFVSYHSFFHMFILLNIKNNICKVKCNCKVGGIKKNYKTAPCGESAPIDVWQGTDRRNETDK